MIWVERAQVRGSGIGVDRVGIVATGPDGCEKSNGLVCQDAVVDGKLIRGLCSDPRFVAGSAELKSKCCDTVLKESIDLFTERFLFLLQRRAGRRTLRQIAPVDDGSPTDPKALRDFVDRLASQDRSHNRRSRLRWIGHRRSS